MKRRSKPIIIPHKFTAIAMFCSAAGCSSPNPPSHDAGSDVPAETSATDALNDLITDTLIDVPVDSERADAVDAVIDSSDCDAQPFSPGVYECFPDPHRDPSLTCTHAYVCSADMCPPGCVGCTGSGGEIAGYACVQLTPSTDGGTPCPTDRICDPADCPNGCTACREVVFCAPDPTADAPVANCDPQYVCDFNQCPTGCIGFG